MITHVSKALLARLSFLLSVGALACCTETEHFGASASPLTLESFGFEAVPTKKLFPVSPSEAEAILSKQLRAGDNASGRACGTPSRQRSLAAFGYCRIGDVRSTSCVMGRRSTAASCRSENGRT